MAKVLKIDNEQIIDENDRKIQRFIFNDDKIVRVDLDGNVLTENVPDRYLELISIYCVSDKKSPTKSTSRAKDLKGLGGWLVVFVVQLICSIVFSIVGSISNTMTASECDLVNSQFNGACTAMQPMFVFEDIFVTLIIIFDVIILIMLFLQKRIAINLVIIGAIATICWNIIDTILVSQLFSAHDFPSSVISEVMSGQVFIIIGNAIYCGIWIPYFIKSERIKQTLIK